ncbi:hypothetical protein M5M_05487 [Simiduia agarivorans SA1 = DSM 21679]|uniref:Uncharacterized protein n=1 Tax=Simiduia agarivorans (strain DSM 21679 / JCM 13881 / BCRC 17597 / SA1) TaxID=1117647 RepID=R9S5Z7_SIMAS|nr:hypothetical protein M5M_05487 [Simiduia agarivorans SA1 = DSM 21679]
MDTVEINDAKAGVQTGIPRLKAAMVNPLHNRDRTIAIEFVYGDDSSKFKYRLQKGY